MSIEPGKELLWKYAMGQCSEQEVAFVETWIHSSEENYMEFERIKLYMQNNNAEMDTKEQIKQAEIAEDIKFSVKNYALPILLILIVLLLFGLFYFIKN